MTDVLRFILGCVLSLVYAYGWMPFLICGIAKRRRGEGGKGLIITARVWGGALVAFLFFYSWSTIRSARFLQGGLVAVSCVIGCLAFVMVSGWVPLLIWGVARWRRKTGGKGMALSSGVWGLFVVFAVGAWIVAANRRSARWASREFSPETYTGEVATVELPYEGQGELSLYPQDEDPYRWGIALSGMTNRVVIPAGDYARANVSIMPSFAGKEAPDRYGLNCAFDSFSVTKDEVFVFPGGGPITASVEVSEAREKQIYLRLTLVDSATNSITIDDRYSSKRPPIGFEALTPGGERFWADDFEWG